MCHCLRVAQKMFPPEKRLNRQCKDCGKEISHRSARGKGRCKMCDILERGRKAAVSKAAAFGCQNYDAYCDDDNNTSACTDWAEESRLKNRENMSRSAFRENPGSAYFDKNGNIHYATDVLRSTDNQNTHTKTPCKADWEDAEINYYCNEVGDDDAYQGYSDTVSGRPGECFTVASAWASLRKCWKGFWIAKSNYDLQSMIVYENRIRKLRDMLNLPKKQDEFT